MVSLEREKNIEVLRQAAILLEAENRHLHRRIAEVLAELTALKGGDTKALQLELEKLQRQLALQNEKLFAPSSSERRGEPTSAAKKPQTGHGRREQPALPSIERIWALGEDQLQCEKCGGTLNPMKGEFEPSEEITVVHRRFELHKHLRQKYRCSCNECIVTAPGPLKLFEGARYSIDFAIGIAVDKYTDHQPLERQCRAMKRDGLVTDSQTLWDYLEALAAVLEPLRPRLRALVLTDAVVHADETRWRKMAARGEKGSEWWYDWTICSSRAVYHHIDPSRGAQVARELLAGYRGTVMADGYSVYSSLAQSRDGPSFRLASCWPHARRKFLEVEKNFPQPVSEILGLIAELYRIEGEVASNGAEGLAQRARLRAEKSTQVIEDIERWGNRTLAMVLPSSGLAEAIKYMQGQWKGLTVFLADPLVPLDNNFAERSLRGVVLGRKNHYGSRSERGAEVAALMYTLMETCKLHRVDPRAYLKAAVIARLTHQPMPLPHEHAAAVPQP
ncbi:MAG: IS66 family transposase [Myxococcales bacterium]